MASQPVTVPPVDDRIEAMKNSLRAQYDEAERVLPGLTKFLEEYLGSDKELSSTEFAKAFFKAFRFSKDKNVKKAYDTAVSGYTTEEQKQLERFAKGESEREIGKEFKQGVSAKTREEMTEMEEAPTVKEFDIDDVVNGHMEETGVLEKAWDSVREFFGGSTSRARWRVELADSLAIHRFLKMGAYITLQFENAPFHNWGGTVKNTPLFTFVPKNVKEIQAIVMYAKKKGKRVRVSGYRHSWPPLFSADNQILISMLDLDRVDKIPDVTSLGFFDLWGTADEPLESIRFATDHFDKNNQRLVRLGTAVTHETLRRWCIENDVAIPSNTVIVEITMGGSNGTMCHGAGIKNKTLSDLVVAMEYVDVNGKMQKLEDPKLLKAAAGCFGLLGVVTHITLRLDKLKYAKMIPLKIPAAFAIPPPDNVVKNAPIDMEHLMKPWKALSADQKQEKIREFEKRAENDYYSEWFWFPLSDYSWVNTWNTTDDKKDIEKAVSYPSPGKVFIQFVEAIAQNVLQNNEALNSIIKFFHLQNPITTIRSRLAMSQLPDKTIITTVPDAIHFQRALQNIGGIRDMELEIPLQPRPSDPKRPDFNLVRRAWWDAILQVYSPKNLKEVPMNLTLEMRMTGGSDIIMAAQRHANLGCCSIEVIALLNTPESFPSFAQQITNTWTSYTDAQGNPLKTRPHWGKEWYKFKVNGKPWLDHMKQNLYKEEIVEFKQTLSAIGTKQGWKLDDLQNLFSNELLDELIFSKPWPPGSAKQQNWPRR